METIDDETTAAAIDFMARQVQAKKPFFVWMNTTRMHVFTHVRESMRGQSGMPGNEYADGMIEHDGDVGKLLKALDDLGMANNTIVVYSTDNGPNQFSWPDAATTPFRSEKDTNWEGAFRVPAAVRWPGHIKPGEISTAMISGLDWFPTLLAAAGDTTLRNASSRARTLAVRPPRCISMVTTSSITSLEKTRPARAEILPISTTMANSLHSGTTIGRPCLPNRKNQAALRCGTSHSPPIAYRRSSICRMDPFERADIASDQYDDWRIKNAYLMGWMNLKAAAFLETFKQFPPSQAPASFTIDQVQKDIDRQMERLSTKSTQ